MKNTWNDYDGVTLRHEPRVIQLNAVGSVFHSFEMFLPASLLPGNATRKPRLVSLVMQKKKGGGREKKERKKHREKKGYVIR